MIYESFCCHVFGEYVERKQPDILNKNPSKSYRATLKLLNQHSRLVAPNPYIWPDYMVEDHNYEIECCVKIGYTKIQELCEGTHLVYYALDIKDSKFEKMCRKSNTLEDHKGNCEYLKKALVQDLDLKVSDYEVAEV